jgi:hypothetical protein
MRFAIHALLDAFEHASCSIGFKVNRNRAGSSTADLNGGDRLGHAWSGGAARQALSDIRGPDVSRMAWARANRQFRA